MGELIATTQATVDGVVDPVGEWVQADGDRGVRSFERQARPSGLVLGRKSVEGLAADLAEPSRASGRTSFQPDAEVRRVQDPVRR